MSTINDGGPAFATQLETNRDGYAITGGMTLRDYFAAKAMQGLCAHPESPDWDESDIAKSAYDQADAMLKARAK